MPIDYLPIYFVLFFFFKVTLCATIKMKNSNYRKHKKKDMFAIYRSYYM